MIPSFTYSKKVALFLLSFGLLISCAARADVLLKDDFKSYAVGTWPSPNWLQVWNASDLANNGIRSDPTDSNNKVLKLYGVEGNSAAAVRSIGSLPAVFAVEARIYNESEPRPVGWGRGSIALWQGRTFFTFDSDGNLHAGGSGGLVLAAYQTERWYDVKVAYLRQGSNVTLTYWLDGTFLSQLSDTVGNDLSADQIVLDAGSSAYFDNIRVTTGLDTGLIAYCDDFSTDTTASYNATYWQYYGASATPSILYDAPNQRAIVQGVGGYGAIVMEQNGESPIPAGCDFTFSADLSILSEFNGYLYLGDNRPMPPVGGTGTGMRLNIGTYTAYNCDLEIYQNGVNITDLRLPYTPQSLNNLRISRVNGQYSFYVNNTLFWTQAIPALNGMPLYYGVGNEISSGPSGITAQTAVDNICVTLPDGDADGVPDGLDQCPNTPPGAIVNTNGCSIAQLVPCGGPLSGGAWKNHGEYLFSVIKTATDFLKANLITRRDWAQIVSRAARSKCGWNNRWDHGWDRDWNRDWDWDHDGNRQHTDSDRR